MIEVNKIIRTERSSSGIFSKKILSNGTGPYPFAIINRTSLPFPSISERTNPIVIPGRSTSGLIILDLPSFYSDRIIDMKIKSIFVKDEDREISLMSDAEIVGAVEALFGAWADRDDLDDDWYDEFRGTWFDQLEGMNNESREVDSF